MADDAIARGGIGSLGSLVYFCGFDSLQSSPKTPKFKPVRSYFVIGLHQTASAKLDQTYFICNKNFSF